MATNDVARRIHKFNRGRNPDLLKRKYKAIRSDPFVFLRGTCHLFYQDWPRDTPLNKAPAVWICGDLHIENFGAYKGDNRMIYFDINDFDEGVLAPCTWDIARLLTSMLLGARSLKVSEPDALKLCRSYLDAYRDELANGHARMLDRGEAAGMIKDLLKGLQKRDRAEFLDTRTTVKKGRRRLNIDDVRMMAVPANERARIKPLLTAWAAGQQNPKFYKLLDIAYRIAGTGSLGVKRYVLLVEGRGSPNGNFLLDLKAAGPSALEPVVTQPQPAWSSYAERAAAIQERLQAAPLALLQAVVLDGKSFLLRELQPTQDRVEMAQWNGKLRRLERVLETMGRVTAWNQLRSGGRQGSAIADDLIAFAAAPQWPEDVLDYARFYAGKVEADYRDFCAAREE